ncbi:MAG TPA: prefoldin subunit beta [Candidatus Aenigmarchaeota archaeon]|nr:MAG: prefoldin subunit beta [Nanoarchaeota archaeon]HDO79993.1 prefoldin subunit beta [Candidatus Aenigmarchaeota archaeon]HEX33045.1 prefoldin subunit beta [Candidatus Aenigmarchaeota archaeon]
MNTEQQIQTLMLQKQNVQMQLAEVENALNELKSTKDDVYEIVGTIMVKKSKDELMSKLKDKQEILNLRLSRIEKQLDKLNKELEK